MDKTEAIKGAMGAAFDNVGFMLVGTKAQSDQLKTSSLVAARNVVAVRKQIVSVASKFKSFQTALAQITAIVSKKGDADSKVAMIGAVLAAGGDAYKQKEAEQEQKPSALSMTARGADAVAGMMPAAVGLAFAIPFLLSPEVRAMLGEFFKGFLDGLGLGKDTLDKVKIGLGIITGVIGAYFSAKVIMGVVDAFQQMQKLAQVLGLAGDVVATEKNKIDTEKDQVKKAGDKAKGELKDTKKDLRKGRKLSALKKPGFLLKTIAPKLLGLLKNIGKALPIVGTVLGIGAVLFDLFDIGKDIYDFFFGKDTDEVEEEQGTSQEESPAPAASAPPASSSSVPASAEPESKPPAANTSTTPPPSTAAAAPTETPAANETPPSSTGTAVSQSSVSVAAAETDLAQTAGGVNILNVDNSTTIIDAGNQTPPPAGAPVYSITVGA